MAGPDTSNRSITVAKALTVVADSYSPVTATETVPLQPIVVGRYFDTFSCGDGGWYFTARQVDVEMVGDISAHLMVDPSEFDR